MVQVDENQRPKPNYWIYILLLLNLIQVIAVINLNNNLNRDLLEDISRQNVISNSAIDRIRFFLWIIVLFILFISVYLFRLKNSARMILLVVTILDFSLALAIGVPFWYYLRTIVNFYPLAIDHPTRELFHRRAAWDKIQDENKKMKFHKIFG